VLRVELSKDKLLVVSEVNLPRGDWTSEALDFFVAFGAPGLLDRYLRLPFTLPPDQLRRAVEVLASESGEHLAARRRTVEPAYVV